MTTAQSIKNDINHFTTLLERAKKVEPKNELEKYFIKDSIKFYKQQIEELQFCLSLELNK